MRPINIPRQYSIRDPVAREGSLVRLPVAQLQGSARIRFRLSSTLLELVRFALAGIPPLRRPNSLGSSLTAHWTSNKQRLGVRLRRLEGLAGHRARLLHKHNLVCLAVATLLGRMAVDADQHGQFCSAKEKRLSGGYAFLPLTMRN